MSAILRHEGSLLALIDAIEAWFEPYMLASGCYDTGALCEGEWRILQAVAHAKRDMERSAEERKTVQRGEPCPNN